MIRAVVMNLATIVATLALVGPADMAQSQGTSLTTLRLDGVGPLKLGMSRAAAVKTGWLSNRSTGCKLGGSPYPITYRFRGHAAPKGLTGIAQFTGGRLTELSFTKGVRTASAVVPGSTTVAQMVTLYRAAGYKVKAQFSGLFDGTFVMVTKANRPIIGAFASAKVVTMLALPRISVCE